MYKKKCLINIELTIDDFMIELFFVNSNAKNINSTNKPLFFI